MELHRGFLLLAIFYFSNVYCQEPCVLPMLDFTKTPVFRPYIYKLDGKLYDAKNDKIRIPSGEEFMASCENNLFRAYPGQHNLTVKCDDDSLIVDKSKTNFKNLNCDIRIMEDIKHNVEGCDIKDGGMFYQYYNSRSGENIVLAEVCFDFTEDQTKFIRFSYPQDYSKTHTETLQPSSSIAHKISMLSTYRSDLIKERVTTLLGESYKLVGQTVDGIRLMTKIFVNPQLQDVERYSVTNMAGVWTSVVGGNWDNIMKDIEDFGKDRKKPLQIILGAHNVLTLSHPSDGRDVRMYLKEDHKVPVPEYIWTIVYDKEKNQGVALVTLNNPFAKYEKLKIHEFCPNRCNEITWLKRLRRNDNYDKPIYGYTYCCKIDNFPMYSSLKKLDLLKV